MFWNECSLLSILLASFYQTQLPNISSQVSILRFHHYGQNNQLLSTQRDILELLHVVRGVVPWPARKVKRISYGNEYTCWYSIEFWNDFGVSKTVVEWRRVPLRRQNGPLAHDSVELWVPQRDACLVVSPGVLRRRVWMIVPGDHPLSVTHCQRYTVTTSITYLTF